MTSMIIWVMAIGLSTAILVIAAAAKMHVTHLTVCAAMAMLLAALASRENDEALARGASQSELASGNARHMGLVWAWGALVLVITYTTVLGWKEWWQFFMAFVAVAGLCLFFSVILRNDSEGRGEDASMLKLSRYLSIAQLVGTVVAMIGLLVDGKMTRFLNPRHTDWAANNVFFFGALALAVISFIALQASSKSSKS